MFGNVDVMIIVQVLKMLLYILQMCVFIVEDFGCYMDDVNVKVIIIEKFGFIGCGEGIVCEVVVLLCKVDK